MRLYYTVQTNPSSNNFYTLAKRQLNAKDEYIKRCVINNVINNVLFFLTKSCLTVR